jgi:hypothetical protein
VSVKVCSRSWPGPKRPPWAVALTFAPEGGHASWQTRRGRSLLTLLRLQWAPCGSLMPPGVAVGVKVYRGTVAWSTVAFLGRLIDSVTSTACSRDKGAACPSFGRPRSKGPFHPCGQRRRRRHPRVVLHDLSPFDYGGDQDSDSQCNEQRASQTVAKEYVHTAEAGLLREPPAPKRPLTIVPIL